ncbi:WD40/YVTN/BNR-like repeat-containing protein [Microbulbifer sp. SA54]|uniref:WD40/YVTN/BNR-like repeat-containing protein n=1 Tax=Microbulbifer sp. SA54 TaxID=3401577 RepID=UPI003AAE736E
MERKVSLRGSAVGKSSFWVTGTENAVFRSIDGGDTWQDVSVTGQPVTDFRDIEVFDDHTAIVMGVGTGSESRLYLTEDGGGHWELLYSNPDSTGFFDSIAFWSRNDGLLLGDPVDGYYVVMRTRDGGRSWKRVDRDHLPSLSENEAAFAASGNTLIAGAAGEAWFTTGGFAASVYSTSDFGQSWERIPVPIHSETATSGGYALGRNRQGQVFVMGGDFQNRPGKYPNVAAFGDQGWQSLDTGQRGLRTAMACAERLCVISGKTGSDVSFDHGTTWRAMPGNGYYTLAVGKTVGGKEVILAAGHDGRVATLSVKKSGG